MNAFVRPSTHAFVPPQSPSGRAGTAGRTARRGRPTALTASLNEIDVPAPLLAYHATRTVELARLIRAGNPIAPLSIVRRHGRYILIEGKDELAAWKLVGARMAPVCFVKNTGLNWRERRLTNQ